MQPRSEFIVINDNLEKIRQFINEIIITPKHLLSQWSQITNQTPAAKIGYIGQHLASLVTGVRGTGSGARGDDLADGSEVKSCNKIDQADKCRNCGARVLRMETVCGECGSDRIERKDDSKWLFSVRDEHELEQYLTIDRIVLLLMDYPNFDNNDFADVRISIFEIYPREQRMSVFGELIRNHYYNIYLPKITNNEKTNPMNLHPWGFQFYKCNPIRTFECLIRNIDTNAEVVINNYLEPNLERDNSIEPLPMPTSLLRPNEWQELLDKANFDEEIRPLLTSQAYSRYDFERLAKSRKESVLPFINEKLRGYISLRPINNAVRQRQHYQR